MTWFLSWVQMEEFQIYEKYCQNKPRSESLWRQCSDCPFFQVCYGTLFRVSSPLLIDSQTKNNENCVNQRFRWLQECQKKLDHKLSLDSYLLKPVQRITKYQLLLKVRPRAAMPGRAFPGALLPAWLPCSRLTVIIPSCHAPTQFQLPQTSLNTLASESASSHLCKGLALHRPLWRTYYALAIVGAGTVTCAYGQTPPPGAHAQRVFTPTLGCAPSPVFLARPLLCPLSLWAQQRQLHGPE